MNNLLSCGSWAGALAAFVLEKSSKYIEYSCGFFSGRARDRTPPTSRP
jgi:hypothetical protein